MFIDAAAAAQRQSVSLTVEEESYGRSPVIENI